MIPKGFLISWETEAIIAPRLAILSDWCSFSTNFLRSSALFSMIVSPRLTIKSRTTNNKRIRVTEIRTNRYWSQRIS